MELLSGKDQREHSLKIDSPPASILMVGLQGSGKTTTSAKLANFLKKTSSLGINRVVPVGKALNMGFVWDGFEIDKKLTKLVELI